MERQYTIHNFRVAIYDNEMDILRKYDFSSDVLDLSIDEDEKWLIDDLKLKGIIASFNYDKGEYYIGTGLYHQLNIN